MAILVIAVQSEKVCQKCACTSGRVTDSISGKKVARYTGCLLLAGGEKSTQSGILSGQKNCDMKLRR